MWPSQSVSLRLCLQHELCCIVSCLENWLSLCCTSVCFLAPVVVNRENVMLVFWELHSLYVTGTLVQRMLGQKKTKDDRLNTVTAAEFFAHYPSLSTFFLEHLNHAAASHQGTSIVLHPSLYPILTILAKLGVGIQDHSERSDIVFSVVCSLEENVTLNCLARECEAFFLWTTSIEINNLHVLTLKICIIPQVIVNPGVRTSQTLPSQPVNQSVNQSSSQSISRSINQSINQSIKSVSQISEINLSVNQ